MLNKFDILFDDLMQMVSLSSLLQVSSDREKKTPPKFAERLLYSVASVEYREALIGDLAEEYFNIRVARGERSAKLWYYKEVVTSLHHFFRRCVHRMFVASTMRVLARTRDK